MSCTYARIVRQDKAEAPQSRQSFHILIVGGGLAGLASALALNQAGHRVTILERMPELRQVGAGIQLSPNATRILRAWGILDNILQHAYQPQTGGLLSWRDGALLSPALPPAGWIEETYMAPYLVVHRADLLAALVSTATARGVSFRLGCEVAELDLSRDAAAAVLLSSGERVEGDLVLGADGERSVCRDILLGRRDPPLPTGDVVFRIAVSRSDILADPTHPSSGLMQPGRTNVWMGPDAHAVSYLLNNNDILNVVLVKRDDKQGYGSNGESVMYGPQPAELEELRRAFDDWDPALRALLDVPGKSHCSKWSMLRLSDIQSWRHQGGARFCLIGDAAHGMPPYLAQGAAQAFEDAAVLGAIFSRLTLADENPDEDLISDALGVFESVRKPRVDKVRERTLARKHMYDLHDGPEQWARDQNLASAALGNGEESPDELARPDFQKWLWGYDAAVDGARAWEQRHR